MSHSLKMADHHNIKNNEYSFLMEHEKRFKYVVFVICILSILGSFLIIFTFIIYRDLRTNVRLIFVHLSIMDFGIAASNMIGTAVNFNSYYYNHSDEITIQLEPKKYIQVLCKTQAFFALYSTYASVFWTNCLAVYLYIAVVRCSAKRKRVAMWSILYGCGYGIPLILSLWLVVSDK